ncbi:hypothetical protein MC885_012965 [Smutsia gigantea]|nr:hypothetical protein MC885_012965 [Smutsia gigantea]
MDQAWDIACGPRPSTASVQVRELSWQGLHNPCPQSKDRGSHGGSHCEPLVEYLSPARLQALAQVDDLRLVSMLEMCVNTRDISLGTFGVHLPNLRHLKLNGSCLGSVRWTGTCSSHQSPPGQLESPAEGDMHTWSLQDLGTSLGHLQVLWLARCGLTNLDGIGSFPALKELYVSYNDISDLSPLCLLEQLEVLDLEGNSVEGLGQLRYLQLCPRLATLTLEGNLVCLRPSPFNKAPQGYNYRAEVRKLIPQLQVLDEVPALHTGLPASWKLDRDWLMVKETTKEGSVLDSLLPRLGTAATHLARAVPLSLETWSPTVPPQARPLTAGLPIFFNSLSPERCIPASRPGHPSCEQHLVGPHPSTLWHWALGHTDVGWRGSLVYGQNRPHEAPIRGLSPELSRPETQPQALRPWPLSLLVPGDPVPEGLLPKDTAPEDDTSNLTHGGGPVLCGNPTKGLREHRHKSQAWAPPEQLPPYRLEDKVATPGSDPADSHDFLALAGLQAWKEQRLWCLESQQERMAAPRGPQRGPEEQEGKAVPKIPRIPLSLVSGTPHTSEQLGSEWHWEVLSWGWVPIPSPLLRYGT